MKTEQEINNLRGGILALRTNVSNLTAKLDAARKQLYDDTIRLYQYESGLNVGDTISWRRDIKNGKYGFEGLDEEPIKEPIGEIQAFEYTDYTGMRLYVKRGDLHCIISAKDIIEPVKSI